MAGLDPAIHVFLVPDKMKTWITGTSPVMTTGCVDYFIFKIVKALRMSAREDVYARHQQTRWMRPDAHRWMRPDAVDVPDGDSPELPSNEPPEIPESWPDSTQGRMGFVRAAAEWVARMGRYSPAASAYLGALDQVDELKALTDTIKSANDPPRSLEELQDRVGLSNEGGYHKHHIVEESAARDAGFSEDLIQGRDNLFRIPILKHIDITRYYSTKTEQPDGSRISPRESLKNKTFEERRQFGLMILRGKGVLK